MSGESFDPAPYTGAARPNEPRQKGPSRVTRYLIVSLLSALVGAYALTAFLTRDLWAGVADGTEVTFAAKTPDGSPPTHDDLARTRKVVSDRIAMLGISGADVAVEGSTVTVTVPGNGDDVRNLGEGGRLYLRPVLHVISTGAAKPTAAAVVPPAPGTTADPAQDLADEKALRQSTDQKIQLLAVQFQATRCNDEDALAGNDDPNLPLVTCSQDGELVYVLDRSIVSGDQIAGAVSKHDEQHDEYAVEVEFDPDATKAFARFTAANVGTQIAYTLDTRVMSAPAIQEPIPRGLVMITGRFTPDQSRALATTLGSGSLPLTLSVESSKPAPVRVSTAWTPLRIGLGAGGIVLALAVAGAVVYLVSSRREGPAW